MGLVVHQSAVHHNVEHIVAYSMRGPIDPHNGIMGARQRVTTATKSGAALADAAATATSASPQDLGRALPTAVRFGMQSRTVCIYLAVAGLMLAPGLLLWLIPDAELGFGRADTWLRTLRRGLRDIRFGSGPRFWLGVAGASMMALLLLYPLRKALAKRRWLGSVGGWFHLHIAFGVFGPVLVLYHTNFGHGAPDANVALWTMLAVALSGIVGQFIYANVSATFYANKQAAREQLDAIGATLLHLDAMHPSRQTLIDDLAAFDADLLTPRLGIVASVAARLRMERRRGALARAIGWHIAKSAEQLQLSYAEQMHVRSVVGRYFGAYMRIARQASMRSLREQVWARWRLFHLPAFLLMLVAMGLHVTAVWNIDVPGAHQATSSGGAVQSSIFPGMSASPEISPRRETQSIAAESVTAWGTRRVRTLPATGEATPDPVPVLKVKPTPAKRPAAAAQSVPPPPITLRNETSLPPPVIAETAQPVAKGQARATAAVDEIAELQRRFDDLPPSGVASPRTLVQQIDELKLRQKDKLFAHSQSETGFALTGQHKTVECASCHVKPLTEPMLASSNPRQCVNCHKKDDPHRGRRPNCATCHATSRWNAIIRE